MRARLPLLLLSWLAAVNGRAPLFALGPVLPLVVADLGLSFTLAGVLPSLPLLFMGLCALPGGLVVDRFGARRLVAVGLLVVGLAGAGRALAPSAALLALTTALLGGAIGILQPALPRVARDAWPGRVGLATAVYSNGFILGGFLGIALTPPLLVLVGALSWRGLFVVWGLAALVGAAGWAVAARGEQRARAALPTSAAATLGSPWRSVVDAMRIPGLLPLTIAFGSQSAIFYAFGSWLPAYLMSHGWSLAATAGPAATVALVAIPVGLLTTPLVDVVGRRPVLALAGLATLPAPIGLLFWPDGAWLWAALAGGGTTAAFSVCLTGPAELAAPDRVGATAGAMLTLGYVASVTGPLTIGALRDLTGGYELGLWVLALLAVVLTAAALETPSRSSRLAPGVA